MSPPTLPVATFTAAAVATTTTATAILLLPLLPLLVGGRISDQGHVLAMCFLSVPFTFVAMFLMHVFVAMFFMHVPFMSIQCPPLLHPIRMQTLQLISGAV